MTISEYTALTAFLAGVSLYTHEFLNYVYSALFTTLPF
jgi:hypothetical protein